MFGGSGVMDALHTVHAQLPESFFDFLGASSLSNFTWYYIAAISLMACSQLMGWNSPSTFFRGEVRRSAGYWW